VIEFARGYAADEAGAIFCNRPINGKGSAALAWRPVKPQPCSGGRYLQVGVDGRKRMVHRIVATAFFGQCPPGYEVAHLNGDSKDNRAANLAFVPHKANECMKRAHGTAPGGESNGMAKLTATQASDIRERLRAGRRGVQAEIAREYGVSPSLVCGIASGKRWAEQSPSGGQWATEDF